MTAPEKNRANFLRYRDKQRAAGRCEGCGQKKDDTRFCRSCREAKRVAWRKYAATQREVAHGCAN